MSAHHLDKVAVLNDGLASDDELLANLKSSLKSEPGHVSIVKTVDIPPNSVQVDAAVQELKAANPDVVFIDLGEGYGAIWNSFNTQGWAPTVIASAGSLYSGYTALGALGAHAYTRELRLCSRRNRLPHVCRHGNEAIPSLGGVSSRRPGRPAKRCSKGVSPEITRSASTIQTRQQPSNRRSRPWGPGLFGGS